MEAHHTLHPNLAQLVAARDGILAQVTMGQIDWPAARNQLVTLTARDDQGVQWTIGVDDGFWYRRTRSGELVRDVPPSFGVATATAFDVSSGDRFRDPRGRITHQVVDPGMWSSEESLVGSTQRHGPGRADGPRRGLGGFGVAFVLIAVAVVLLWLLWGR